VFEVEEGGGFVEDEGGGLLDEGAGEEDALALAAGEVGEGFLQEVGEAEELGGVADDLEVVGGF
jgi:hypothetical protein